MTPADALQRRMADLDALSILEEITDAFLAVDADGRLTFVNREAERLMSRERGELLGRNLWDEFPATDDCVFFTQYERAMNERVSVSFEEYYAPFSTWFHVRGHPYGNGLAIYFQDITKRKRAEQRQEMQFAVTLVLAEAASLGDAAPRVLEAMCEKLGWSVGTIWMLDETGMAMRCVDTWHAPSLEGGPSLTAMTRLMQFEAGRGIPGRTWTAAEACSFVDPDRDPDVAKSTTSADVLRMAFAAERGLGAAYAFPVVSNGRVIAVLEFFGSEPRRLGDSLREVFTDVGTQLSHFFERVRAQDALRSSEERLRAIFDTTAIGIVLVDSRGLIISSNRAYQQLVGYEGDELRTLSFKDITHPDDLPENLVLWNEMLQGARDGYSFEKRYVRKDGETVWGHLTVNRLTASAGEPEVCLVMVENVTERKRAEEELRAAEQRYRNLVEQLPLATYINAAGETISTLYISPQIEDVLGYPAEAWLEDGFWASRVHPDDRDWVLQRTAETHAAGDDFREQYRMIHRDGRVVSILDQTVPVRDERGAVAFFQGFVLDITERKQLEEQLRQAQKMDAVGQLAGGIAHDFNNLLTAISGYSDFVLSGLEPDDPRRRDAEEIQRAADRAASLTRQLLTFSRGQVLQPRVVDLNAVVKELEKMLRRLIPEDVELVTSLSTELGHVQIDPGQMEQVILNLALNARDAMPNGGRLTIETFNVDGEPGEPTDGAASYVAVAVTDEGHGISEETMSHLYEPFFTTKEHGKGTGLGLSTVYGIVTKSGGSISVDSEPGRGSRFEVKLPRVESVRDDKSPPHRATSGRGTGATVLLVEDEPAVRTLVRQILEHSGYDVLEAPNGAEALRLSELHEAPIDLLLTDVVMPELGGRELARRVMAARPQTKVVYMSGYTFAADNDSVLDDGVAFLQKPFSRELLLQKLDDALGAEVAA